MARYIDADALGIGRADRNAFVVPEYADGWNSAIDIIANAPTAEVAPKSEVAREIFEEVENLFVKDNFRLIGNRGDFAELKKKYTEGANDQKKD